MNKKQTWTAGLLLALVLAFVALAAINQKLFAGWKLDLTENQQYTLTQGTRNILRQIEEPIRLTFYFSDKASKNLPSIRSYAQRVRELLHTYVEEANGKLQLVEVDPEPYSEAEDEAAAAGVRPVPLGRSGEEIYFGLAGSNSLDDQMAIPFFDPSKESLLEYDLSKLIYALQHPDLPKVGLISGLKMQGGFDPATQQMNPPWVIYQQLDQLFDLQLLDATTHEIPQDLSLLILVHPKNLPEESLKAIDHYLAAGGHLLAFVDPTAEQDEAGKDPNNPMAAIRADRSSDLAPLFKAWGVHFDKKKVLLDAAYGVQVSGPSGRPVRHLGILGIQRDGLNRQDAATAQLDQVIVSSAGFFSVDATEGVQQTELVQSSDLAMPTDAARLNFLPNPEILAKGFSPTGEHYPLAVRLQGALPLAWPEGEKKTADNAVVVLVADTDILSDRLWVRRQAFLGQQLVSAFADNGDLVFNLADQLTGSTDLISIRGHASSRRPFLVVQQLQREAEARLRKTEEQLQEQLRETERKLTELQQQKSGNDKLLLSPEQQETLRKFQQEKLRIRKQLRSVQHELNQGIEQLGSRIKFLNIFGMPLLITVFALYLVWRQRKRRQA